MKHPDDAALLEILYFDDDGSPFYPHVTSCPRCERRIGALRDTLEGDRVDHARRVEAKPESFWERQREEILSRAVAANPRPGLLRLRPLLTAVMALLLLAVGVVAVRDENRSAEQEASPVAEIAAINEAELFEQEELRAYDPWRSDELEPFHQVVQWEEWIEDDGPATSGTKEQS